MIRYVPGCTIMRRALNDIPFSRSPAYALFCIVTLTLLGPGPNSQFAHWPRSADYWATAVLVNVTIDDTSSLIAYSPISSWRSSVTPCATCLLPDKYLAYAETWHEGAHILPSDDTDDIHNNIEGVRSNGKGHRSDLERRGRPQRPGRRGNVVDRQAFTPRLDSDDPNFVDTPVTVQFNFTGTS